MRKYLIAMILVVALIPAALALMQSSGPTIEITGINPTELPRTSVTVSVLDSVNQPVDGLTIEDFAIRGELADRARIVSVSRINTDNLPLSVVLVIDVSSSMSGTPIEAARAAARLFVDALNPIDEVAILTVSNQVTLIQDFTSDREALFNAIDTLPVGGETALYEGALAGVQLAAESPSPRRVVILLSDGQQYTTLLSGSRATRDAAATEARNRGVPVYTVGLGFGIDRSYLQQLSQSTNARNYESPQPDELEAIYAELAALLRSQYEIVIDSDLPLDGTEYALELEVTTPEGTRSASGTLRAPVPVPIVRLPQIEGEISELTEVTAVVLADDGIESVAVLVDDQPQITLTEEPYTYIIDPVALSPGAHTIAFVATDTNGDSGSAVAEFTVAPLPSQVTITGLPDNGIITEVTTVTLDISGQTPPVSAEFTLNGESTALDEPPFAFTIDPFTLPPGPAELRVEVENAGGATAEAVAPFTVAGLPPVFEVSGLNVGDELADRAEVSVEVISSQAPIQTITYAINGQAIPASEDDVLALEAFDLAPGDNTLSISVTDSLDQTATRTIAFIVAPLPPRVTIEGLNVGETLDSDREVTVDVVGQTNIVNITISIDGQDMLTRIESPLTYTIDVLSLAPGGHILAARAITSNGQSASANIAFAIAEGPSLTATALAIPTDTPTFTPSPTETPTPTPTETPTATPTLDLTATAVEVTAAAIAVATGDALALIETSTVEAIAMGATATVEAGFAVATVTAEAEESAATVTAEAGFIAATSTLEAALSLTPLIPTETPDPAEVTRAALATESALATATADAVRTQALVDVATRAAVATLEIQRTALAMAGATATEDFNATQMALTAQAQLITATAEALATATTEAELLVTESALATATTEAELLATESALATATTEAELLASESALATATADFALTLTAQVEGTATESALLLAQQEALATEGAQATATEAAVLTATTIAQVTADAALTLTIEAQTLLTLTAEAEATVTGEAEAALTLTSEAEATQTLAALIVPTSTDEPTDEPTEEATEAPSATPTSAAVAQVQASATPTPTDAPLTPIPTATAVGTLIPLQAESVPGVNDALPILIIALIVVLILLALFLVLSRRRRSRA